MPRKYAGPRTGSIVVPEKRLKEIIKEATAGRTDSLNPNVTVEENERILRNSKKEGRVLTLEEEAELVKRFEEGDNKYSTHVHQRGYTENDCDKSDYNTTYCSECGKPM